MIETLGVETNEMTPGVGRQEGASLEEENLPETTEITIELKESTEKIIPIEEVTVIPILSECKYDNTPTHEETISHVKEEEEEMNENTLIESIVYPSIIITTENEQTQTADMPPICLPEVEAVVYSQTEEPKTLREEPESLEDSTTPPMSPTSSEALEDQPTLSDFHDGISLRYSVKH
jgi:hypothetical protein